jgi:hypothetical protein
MSHGLAPVWAGRELEMSLHQPRWQAVLVMNWILMSGAIVLLALLITAWGMAGPGSLHRTFTREVAARWTPLSLAGGVPITDLDLAGLPAPVNRYLRAAGVVGRPRPLAYRLTFRGRIRGGPDEPWMRFHAEQFSEAAEPLRLFYMQARRRGIPIAVMHRYAGGRATMTVRLAGLVTLVDVHGPVLDCSETVTVFNDMCLLAPGTLLDPRITWRERGERTVDASFDAGGQSIAATLTFDDAGLLASFMSDDRSRSSGDGRSFTNLRFMTPVRTHRPFDNVVLAAQADAQWRLSDGQAFTYAEFSITSASFLPRPQ